jgi:hypothetical protein
MEEQMVTKKMPAKKAAKKTAVKKAAGKKTAAKKTAAKKTAATKFQANNGNGSAAAPTLKNVNKGYLNDAYKILRDKLLERSKIEQRGQDESDVNEAMNLMRKAYNSLTGKDPGNGPSPGKLSGIVYF